MTDQVSPAVPALEQAREWKRMAAAGWHDAPDLANALDDAAELTARLARENAEKETLLAAHRREFLDEVRAHGDESAAQECLRDFERESLDAVLVGEQAERRPKTIEDDYAAFFRGQWSAGTPGASWHDEFARCPKCGNATVGLAPPYCIDHASGCTAEKALPDPVGEQAAEPRPMTEDEYVEYIRSGKRDHDVCVPDHETCSAAIRRLVADGVLDDSHLRLFGSPRPVVARSSENDDTREKPYVVKKAMNGSRRSGRWFDEDHLRQGVDTYHLAGAVHDLLSERNRSRLVAPLAKLNADEWRDLFESRPDLRDRIKRLLEEGS